MSDPETLPLKPAPRIVLVEDDPLIAGMIRLNLQQAGFAASWFRDVETWLADAAGPPCDLLVLDVRLPGLSGLQALPLIRRRGLTQPVLMLTVEDVLEKKLQAFADGADDYLAKPFEMAELLARIRALLRRTGGKGREAEEILWINGRRVHLPTRLCRHPGGETALSEREIALLRFFYRHAGRTLRRAEILESVWGMDVDPTPRTIDNFILRFRRLFEDDPARPRLFLTIRRSGYRFEKNA